MAVAFRSSNTANTGATPATNLTVTKPSGTAVNDVLLACITVAGGTNATITPPAGWTLLRASNQSTTITQSLYWKNVVGDEASSFTFGLDTARQASAVIAAYSGASIFVPPSTGINTQASPSTSITPPGGAANTYTAMVCYFYGEYNTTAASTMTSANQTKRADTCTTASPFIETVVSDSYRNSIQATGSDSTPQTNSQSVIHVGTMCYLEDAHHVVNQTVKTPLCIDSYMPSSSQPSSSTTFTTTNSQMVSHYNNELLVLFIKVQKGAATVSSVSGASLTWTLAGRSNTVDGSCEVWYALARTPTGNFQPVITFSTAVVSASCSGVSIIGADLTGSNGSGAIGAVAIAASSSAAPTVNLTTTRNGSWVFACANNPTNSATAWVAGTNQALLRSNGDSTNTTSAGTSQQVAPTPTAGTVVTMDYTAPSAQSCNIIAVEILPAITHGLAATGAGT